MHIKDLLGHFLEQFLPIKPKVLLHLLHIGFATGIVNNADELLLCTVLFFFFWYSAVPTAGQ